MLLNIKSHKVKQFYRMFTPFSFDTHPKYHRGYYQKRDKVIDSCIIISMEKTNCRAYNIQTNIQTSIAPRITKSFLSNPWCLWPNETSVKKPITLLEYKYLTSHCNYDYF